MQKTWEIFLRCVLVYLKRIQFINNCIERIKLFLLRIEEHYQTIKNNSNNNNLNQKNIAIKKINNKSNIINNNNNNNKSKIIKMSGGIETSSSSPSPYHRFILTELMKNPTYNVPVFCLNGNFNNIIGGGSVSGYDVTDNKTSDLLYAPKHHQQPIFIMNDNFHREDERLKTFDKWPLDWLDKKELAQTGMFYTGDEDKVKCYFCEVEIGRWEREDQPVPEHLRWSPNCPLLRRRTTNNVPINADELNHILPPISYDVCGTHDSFELSRPNVYAEYPEYAIEASRERSFTDWPRHMKQTAAQMAEAGFFHSGSGDRVKCFSCGGGLKDWDDSDEPWEQHALWLPKCRFLKLMKGQNFIDAVIAKQKQAANNGGGCGGDDDCGHGGGGGGGGVGLGNGNGDGEKVVNQKPSVATVATLTTEIEQNNDVNNATTTTTVAAAAAAATAATTSSEAILISRPRDDGPTSDVATTTTTTYNGSCSGSVTMPSPASAPAPQSTNIPEEKLCKICYTNEYNTAFLPCGHVVACAKCASSVTKCPMCRKHFTDIMRVYFS